MERIRSSDVLDATHTVTKCFRGTVLGYFRREGPNTWDDYRFVPARVTRSGGEPALSRESQVDQTADEVLDVLPQVPVQLEARGIDVRVRSQGRVVRLRWLPGSDERSEFGADSGPRGMRQYFVEHYLSPLESEGGIGAAAVIVKKIGG